MSFMEMQIYKKGALYSADCSKCGATNFTHEWLHMDDHNERRDAMEAGILRCDHCNGTVDPETFTKCRDSYAGWYSAPGYMDCTDPSFDTNKRRLERELRDMYGDAS